MKLLVVVCMLATVYGSSVVDTECAWGESYWCSSLRAASQCGAFQHCMDTVWKNTKVEKDTTDVCAFCESIIKDVRAFVDDKANQDKVKTFMDNACNIIPIPSLAEQCKTTVNEQFELLIQMIDSELDPAVVCSCIGLCSGFKDQVKHTPAKPVVKVTEDPLCTDCKQFFTDLKAKLTDATTEKQVQQMIEDELCSQMGQYADMCKLAVETYLPEIFQMLSSEVDPALICASLGFCTSTPEARALLAKIRLQKSPIYASIKAGSAEECLLCKTILSELQNLDRDATVQADVENFLKKNLCGMMGTLQAVCESTVDTYGPELFELLVNELDPSERCAALGFCASTIKNDVRQATPLTKPKSAPPKVPEVKDPSTQCVLCEFVIKTLQSQLSDNATEAEILKALDEVCDILPDTIKAPCEQFVKQYGPTVIALLLQELDPEQVCTKLGLCGAAVTLKTSTQCVLCEFVMQEIDQLLQSNATDAEIIQALDKVCSILPSSITADCTDFVNTYGPAVLALLEQELDPATICGVLGLCSGAKKVHKIVVAVSDDPNCGICETVIQYIDSLLEENGTIVEIEQVLDKVCNFLPDNIKQECEEFVHTYEPIIVQMLAQLMDPKEICTEIGLCSKATKEINAVDMVKLVPAKAHMLGENECTQGPAFWCLNIDNALKCKGVEHCKNHVWN